MTEKRAANSLRRPTVAVTAVATAAAGIAAVAIWDQLRNGTRADGPLVFPLEYSTILAPLGEPGFSAFDACVKGPSQRIRITSVEARMAAGDGQAQVRVGWIQPDSQPKWGAGRLSYLDPVYQPVGGAITGMVSTCHSGGSRFELAVLFPPVTINDVLVDRVTVNYTADGAGYQEHVDVRLGACASDSNAPSTVEECASQR